MKFLHFLFISLLISVVLSAKGLKSSSGTHSNFLSSDEAAHMKVYSSNNAQASTSLSVCGANFYNNNPLTLSNGKYYINLWKPNYAVDLNQKNANTSYTKIAFDPITWLVDTGDFTYTTSTLSTHSVAYGFAMGCAGTWTPNAHTRIDLTGTPFAVDDMFVINGYLPNGNAVFSSNNQIVDIMGGGDCGWTAPMAQDAIGGNYLMTGGKFLKLALVKC